MANKENKKEKFIIKNLSENVRKKIFVFSITILSLIIITLWIFTFSQTIKNTGGNPSLIKTEEIKQDLKNIVDETKTDLGDLKEQIEKIPNVTTEQQMQKEPIELLKEKILENDKLKQ